MFRCVFSVNFTFMLNQQFVKVWNDRLSEFMVSLIETKSYGTVSML